MATKKKSRVPSLALGIIALVAMIFLLVNVFGGGGYKKIDTEQGLALLQGSTVEQAEIVDGNQQQVNLVLTQDFEDKGKKVQTRSRSPPGSPRCCSPSCRCCCSWACSGSSS